MKKSYDFCLPVFKQGSDLSFHLEKNKNRPIPSLKRMAEQYRLAAQLCEDLAKRIKQSDDATINLEADNHCIVVNCSEDFGKLLVQADLAREIDLDEDIEEDSN